MTKIEKLANHLYQAAVDHRGVEPVTDLAPDLSIEDAYAIQIYNVDRQVEQGEEIVGKKIGLTSQAMQDLLGVDEPDYGHLLTNMVIDPKNPVVDINELLQPRVEGELAFLLKSDLVGPEITVADVLEATEYIYPAIEVVDSRVADWEIRIEDTVADNGSSALYVLGEKRYRPDEFDRIGVHMTLYKNDEKINEGTGAAVLGDSAYCVAWLANKLSEFNITLKAGEVILAGALSAAVNAKAGDTFRCEFTEGLGSVSVEFRG